MKNKDYFEKYPFLNKNISYDSINGELCIENKGIYNFIVQKLFKKPRFSHIQLDELGNHVFSLIDGKNTLYDIGKSMKDKFGNKAEPVNERLIFYFKVLENYGFIEWKNPFI